jgi:glycosyltransferase involved in cell wall biosynthesis
MNDRNAVVVGPVDRAQLLEEYAAASVVVLVSRFRAGRDPMGEGLGLALLEAAAAGVPGIANAVSGTTDAVVDGVTGVLVPQDNPTALAGAIAGLLTDENRRLAMSRAARSWVATNHDSAGFGARVVEALHDGIGGR